MRGLHGLTKPCLLIMPIALSNIDKGIDILSMTVVADFVFSVPEKEFV